MKIGIPSEVERGESRVAASPDSVRQLVQAGFEVRVQRGAGEPAGFSDAEYEAAGAEIDWVPLAAGAAAAEEFGDVLPEATLDAIAEHRVALKGPLTTPIGKGLSYCRAA